MNIFRISIQKNDIIRAASTNNVLKKIKPTTVQQVKLNQKRNYTNNKIKSVQSVSIPRHTFSTSFFVTPQFYSGGHPSLNSSFYRSSSNLYKSNSTTEIIPKPVLRKNVNRNIHNCYGFFNTEKKLSLYDSIFRDRSKIFRRSKKDIVDNKVNILYGDQIGQMNKIRIERENKMKFDSLNSLKKVEKQVNDLKESVSFYKCIMDYAYPEYVIEKNKVFSQGKKKMYLVPSEPEFKKIDSEIMENNKKRSKYLLKSIKIKKVTKALVV